MEHDQMPFSNLDLLNEEMDDITLSQVCDSIEKEYEMSKAVEEINLTWSQAANEIELCDSADFQILSDNNFWGFEPVEPSRSQPDSSSDSPLITAGAIKTEESSASRFVPPVSDEEIKQLIENHENRNTKKNTSWAAGVFSAWRNARNASGSEFVPEIQSMTVEQMNHYLTRFVVEARKKDGEPYPPKTLYLICAGLLRFLRDSGVYDKNFLDTKNLHFTEFRKVLDCKMKDLLASGLGTKLRQAEPVLPEDECAIWNKEVFGDKSAESLQCTMFYACKLFGLRGHDEHRSLTCEQFTVGSDLHGKYIEFNGRSSKTYKGGLKDLELSNKRIRHYSQNDEKPIADLFEKYLAALNGGAFYRRPLAGLPIRYGNQVVGVTKLKNMIKVICARAGLSGNYTNHSGKRTCATQLYMAGVDEQEIMRRTGHRSEKSVRKYKVPSMAIQKQTAAILDPPKENVDPKKPKLELSEQDCSTPPVQSVSGRVVLGENRPFFSNCHVYMKY